LLSLSVDSPQDAQALAAHLREQGAWLEVVPGIDSVVVRFDTSVLDAATAERRIDESLAGGVPPMHESAELLEVPIVYGGDYGPDLEALCVELDLSTDEFVALHTGGEYRVDLIGFTPGFAFVGGLDDRLRVPRRKEPRQRVEAGSIGIADGRTGIYALASPGGWPLVGRTPCELFNAQSAEPFRVRAGMRIRFKAIAADEFHL
jgi:KipI family sensor histidine kinase inhibitor